MALSALLRDGQPIGPDAARVRQIRGALHSVFPESRLQRVDRLIESLRACVARVQEQVGLNRRVVRTQVVGRQHDGAGDFPTWWADRRPVPRRTVFVKGNHEDFVWLDEQASPEVLPGLFYLANGTRLNVTVGERSLVVGGLGGCFGPSDFERSSKNLQGYAKRHYTRDEIDALATAGTVDVLLVHDAPAGVRFERHRRGPGYVSEAAGLDDLLRRVRPRVCLFGHHHARFDADVDGISCLGLNKVGMPGNLVAIEFEERGRGWAIAGEWPPRRFAERSVVVGPRPRGEPG